MKLVESDLTMALPNTRDRGQSSSTSAEDEDDEDVPVVQPPTPPDGGWGWWVVLASFLCNMIVDGVCFSFGIVAQEYQTVFKASHSEVGWVGSSLAGCYLLVGPFVSLLCTRYGCRKITMIGSVVTMCGFILSTWASSVGMLIFTYGVIGGIGFGMIYLPSIVCVGHWFEKKRAFTTGIAVCGTGMGQLLFPPLARYLLTRYGWEGKNLIMAGIVLHCAVCGMTFLPLDWHYLKWQKRVKERVEVDHGAIMKALIEHKKRQRTISSGSLDNCVITNDNRLIRLDQRLFEGKRNNSFIAKIKRQLGFSSQSLACSKTSVSGIPSIVLDAVQKDLNKSQVTPVYKPNGVINKQENLSMSQIVKKRSSLPDGYVLKSSFPFSNGSIVVGSSSPKMNGVVKTRSCDIIPSSENIWIEQMMDEPITFNSKQEDGSLPVSGSSCSDVRSMSIPPSLEGSIISIQLIGSNAPGALSSPTSIRYRSSQSIASRYSSQLASSKASYVTGSVLSIPQMRASEDYDRQNKNSLSWKCVKILYDMFDVRLLLNPVFALLVISSFVTLLAFYVPFFYLPSKGISVGMSENAAPLLLCIVGTTNTLGRLLCGWLADRPWVNVLHFNNSALLVAGLAILLCPICKTAEPLAFLAAVFGFCVAVYVSLRSVLLVELLGLEMLTKSFGLLILFQGMAAFIGAPIAGGLRDATGDVNDCFYLAGGLTILSGLLMLPILYLRKLNPDKDISSLMPRDTPINETLRLEHIESQNRTHRVSE